MLATVAVGTTSVAALAMYQAGLALAGSIAGRDLLVYLGFMLLVYPLAGWRVVTIVPAIYLLAVAVVDRGPPLAFSRCPAIPSAVNGRDQKDLFLGRWQGQPG
jgi:hypothetical protein